MKILILGSAFNGLCQRVQRELILMGHDVDQNYGMDETLLRSQLFNFAPQLIVCPFLTHRIPDDIWRDHPCLIVHPGIVGDRGPSSLDWAISQRKTSWGVTLLQADAEMDAGDIWGTENFILRQASKTSVYKREVSQAAVNLIKNAVRDCQRDSFRPLPLDYRRPEVKGTLQPMMRQVDRAIDWATETTASILDKINAADTTPGVLDEIFGVPAHIFGASLEPVLRGAPGEILALAHGAVCRATSDGAIWIRQAKTKFCEAIPPIKLPAATLAQQRLAPAEFQRLSECGNTTAFNDIEVHYLDNAAYIYFDFYNGAASTDQCIRLKEAIITAKKSSASTLVLMGGENFFCNGIHLNTIEAAADPAHESWLNINAIDDVILEIINSPNQITLAALRNNAGAGGAILALACDTVIGRDGIVLNPHYNNMGLYGSEYWTYLLPKRVGAERAQAITTACQPMLGSEALDMRFVDELFHENWDQFHLELEHYVREMSNPENRTLLLANKRLQRQQDEATKPLELYRRAELEQLQQTFEDPQSYYHRARHNFVYKIAPQIPCWSNATHENLERTMGETA